jgi:hypothetical protein
MTPALVLLWLLEGGVSGAGPSGVGTTLVAPPSAREPAGVEASPTDTLVRIPGASFRLGWSPERASAHASFPLIESGARRSVRQGETTWFGAPARATLTYVEGRLAQVRLTTRGASERLSEYIPDDLRRRGYRRVSYSGDEANSSSEWIGPSRAHLTIGGGSVVAEFSPAPPASREEAPRARAVPIETLDFTGTPPPDSLEAPRRTFTPAGPVRPQIAVDAQVFGRVLVIADVDTSGAVERVEVSRGIPELNAAAIDWAGQIWFEPYRHRGRPARFRIAISVAFLPNRPAPGASPR